MEWTSDTTANPPVQTCSASGQVGGVATIHMQFAVPPGAAQISLKSLTIHEEAGHYPDTVATEGSVYLSDGYPCATCGDPNEGLYRYWDYSWLTPQLHNGLHDLTAVVEVQWQGQYPNPPPPPTDYAAAITVDIENLLVTSTAPNNPTPILWDPVTMTTVPITANISCCYKMNQPWTLTIYTSDQTKVKTYTGNQVIGPGTTPVTVNWDGSADYTGLYPDGATPPMAKGVYIFQWTVGTPGGTGRDYDQDKSSFLAFGTPPTDLTPLASDASGDTVQLSQTLQDINDVPPSQCQVDVYQNWDLQDIKTQQFPAGLGTTSEQVHYAITASAGPADIANGASLAFLVSPFDGDAAYDKGHRDRVALQHNYKLWTITVLTWGGNYPLFDSSVETFKDKLPPTVPQADNADGLSTTNHCSLMSFRGAREYPSPLPQTTTNPTPDQILYESVTLANSTGGAYNSGSCPYGVMAQCVDVAILCGHGAPGKFLFGFANTPNDPWTSTGDDRNCYEVADVAADLDNDVGNGGKSLDTLTQNLWGHLRYYQNKEGQNQPVSLVVWLGCNSAQDGKSTGITLPEKTVDWLGARCSAAPVKSWTVAHAESFTKSLAGDHMRGWPGSITIFKAVTDAAGGQDEIGFYGSQTATLPR